MLLALSTVSLADGHDQLVDGRLTGRLVDGRGRRHLAQADVHELKQRVLSSYKLATTRPKIAARSLGLDGGSSADACEVPPPEQVYVQLFIDRLHTLDQHAQTFGLDGYFRAWWRDPRLQYNATCAQSLSLTRTESAGLWKPCVATPGLWQPWPHARPGLLPRTAQSHAPRLLLPPTLELIGAAPTLSETSTGRRR
mmetsp:Transcript_44859/g.124398  ORF Transcript_44859/g.124398 Transcript_44859/m.124398 type:complete len:196 (+) Transcript_44859:18-605(+)|eukprot:4779096-Prymnesium_polylepis.1